MANCGRIISVRGRDPGARICCSIDVTLGGTPAYWIPLPKFGLSFVSHEPPSEISVNEVQK
jgi:hypothetical protein